LFATYLPLIASFFQVPTMKSALIPLVLLSNLFILSCAISPNYGEVGLLDFNKQFQKNLPTKPQYKVEQMGESSFLLTLHQGSILISEGSTRAHYLSIAGKVIAEDVCEKQESNLKEINLQRDGDSSWVHLVGTFTCLSVDGLPETNEPKVAKHDGEANGSYKYEITATGSGFFVSDQGHVLTNHHVIEGCAKIKSSHYGTSFSLIGKDQKNDLALIKISQPSPAVAVFRAERRVMLGEKVVAVGFPLQHILLSGLNVTEGTVSAMGPSGDSTLIQISAPVQPGSSGGPLLDRFGNVIGMVVAKLNALKTALATGDIPQNINFAIHPAITLAFLDSQGIPYSTATSQGELGSVKIAERARGFTTLIECWK
jgi:S1-C subfamily serine protease